MYNKIKKAFTGGFIMLNKVIDFNRSCDASIFETCIQHQVPEMTRDIVLLYDVSDDSRTDCNSIIVTCSGQWYLTRKTTSQLFNLLQNNISISYTLSKEITKNFLLFAKKFPIVLIISYTFRFILLLLIITGVAIITILINRK